MFLYLFKIIILDTDSNNIELTKKEKIILVLQIITYTDSFIIYQMYLNKGNFQKYIHKKKLTDLVCENYLFLLLSVNTLVLRTANQLEIGYIEVITAFTSLISCITTITGLYLDRIQI